MVKRPSFFLGWALVVTTVFTQMLVYGIRNNFGIFFPPILNEFGWTRADTAFMFSLSLIVYGILGPFVGTLADRWDARKMSLIGLIVLTLSTASCALSQQLWHFYVLFGILASIGASLAGWALLGPALVHWFARRRGLVIGLGQIGSGLSFVIGIFIQWTIAQIGWRGAYLVLAGLLTVILLPLNRLFFYYRPEERKLKPYGADDSSVATASIAEEGNYDWTLKEAMKTPQLWLIVLSNTFFWGLGSYLLVAHQVKFAEDMGYSSLFATSIFAFYGVLMTVGNACGFVSDRIGRETIVIIANSMAIVALVALLLVKDNSQPWLLYIYSISLGLAAGIFTPTMVAGAADIFHGKHYGAIAGLLLTGMGMGGVISPWLGGYIYDVTGSYHLAFMLCIGFYAVSGTLFWLAAPRRAQAIRARRLAVLTNGLSVKSGTPVIKQGIEHS